MIAVATGHCDFSLPARGPLQCGEASGVLQTGPPHAVHRGAHHQQ